MRDFYESLCGAVGGESVRRNEPMAARTTLRTGGPAAFFAAVKSREELKAALLLCRRDRIPFYILGNGSNLLVSSRGFEGVMIKLEGEFLSCTAEEREGAAVIEAGAGILLSKIGRFALEHGLTGFEFAAGIPGTLGGAVVMNAGAYGGEMKDIVASALVMTGEGELSELSAGELDFSYRHSCIPEKGYTVLSARLLLRPGDPKQIRERMEELSARRREKQPLEYPSAGSTFKRPEGHFAGKLIEEAGLKGFSLGGAQVSEKHAGFVINRNRAVPEEVRELIGEVQRRVFEMSGVLLEPEVKMLGFDGKAGTEVRPAGTGRETVAKVWPAGTEVQPAGAGREAVAKVRPAGTGRETGARENTSAAAEKNAEPKKRQASSLQEDGADGGREE